MNYRLWSILPLIAMLFATVDASAQMRWTPTVTVVQEGKWAGTRLADGQPNVEGVWSNDIANHDNFTDPQGGIPGDPSKGLRVANGAGDRPLKSRSERAPSRVSDPADGEVPFQPWARAKQQEFAVGFFNAVKPEYIEPLARCAPSGIPTRVHIVRRKH